MENIKEEQNEACPEISVEVGLKFELSKREFELLKKAKNQGYLEYRDSSYQDAEEYNDVWQDSEGVSQMSQELFDERNENSTIKEAERLYSLGLLSFDDMAWHETFKLSELGEMLLEQYDKR